ncbi:MAG: hypothetical protein KC505_10635 [Myxococcales bacterium]|nr:hypothetical protein [Myxococcales bacterium]USN51097.1 MAG: hypothetical protein H6731_01420 [Myxococcales bacterium]
MNVKFINFVLFLLACSFSNHLLHAKQPQKLHENNNLHLAQQDMPEPLDNLILDDISFLANNLKKILSSLREIKIKFLTLGSKQSRFTVALIGSGKNETSLGACILHHEVSLVK